MNIECSNAQNRKYKTELRSAKSACTFLHTYVLTNIQIYRHTNIHTYMHGDPFTFKFAQYIYLRINTKRLLRPNKRTFQRTAAKYIYRLTYVHLLCLLLCANSSPTQALQLSIYCNCPNTCTYIRM